MNALCSKIVCDCTYIFRQSVLRVSVKDVFKELLETVMILKSVKD